MRIDRRHFLGLSGAATIGLAGGSMTPLVRAHGEEPGFGRLIRDPEGVLDLPRGFDYEIISRAGDRMEDGLFVPALADGMAAFPGPKGLTVLVRNHEITNTPPGAGAFGPENALLRRVESRMVYDAGYGTSPSLGGTTTLVYDTRTRRLVRQFLSLAGTRRNCAGGPTPWGSWLSCEETVQLSDTDHERDHGFVFEVPARAEMGLAEPTPITGMGRFNHEACAVHASSSVVYMTEDRGDGCFYRYIPHYPGRLRGGGRLQALMVDGEPGRDTRNWWSNGSIPVGATLRVTWVDLNNVLSPQDDLRYRAQLAGAAKFARGEGLAAGTDAIYFACTSGGPSQKGQIWCYRPGHREGTPSESGASLELLVQPETPRRLDMCDNLTVAPWGDLVVCEDGGGTDHLVGVTPRGRTYRIARNAMSTSEFAGVTFSPDGNTLFVNIQNPGITFAITGPWRQG